MIDIPYKQMLLHGLGNFPIVNRISKRKFVIVYFTDGEPEVMTVKAVGCFFVRTLPHTQSISVPVENILAQSSQSAIEIPAAIGMEEWIERR